MTLRMGVLVLALLGLSAALVCPDGGMCEDKNTCCKDAVGAYGCCPLPHAECCSDHLHCCYEGTLCDLVHGKCVNKTASLPWKRRLPAKQAVLVPQLGGRARAVICPDQESECPDHTTCCELLDGSWGCCPLDKAVCCEDKLHCCPEGTKCDLVHSRCNSASMESFPMLEKLPARKRETDSSPAVSSVTCPNGKTSCPSNCTCCLMTSGDYGCCPYTEAICCIDHIHCCPAGTKCDLEREVCTSGDSHLPLLKKIAALPNDVECPDKTSTCPAQTTCCQMANSTYGCCPMPDAVCCSDHIHCCPPGTTCDLTYGICVSAHGEPSAAVKLAAAGAELVAERSGGQAALKRQYSKSGAIPCNDSVACADRSTCCKSLQGEWACCPLAEAVCCEDHQHCCPHGTTCNLAASTCDDPKGRAVTSWFSKELAFPSLTDNTKCDESTSCPSKSTCCKTASGAWACCPLPKAVCCEDHLHCCPHDTVCNLEAETCDDPSGFLPPRRWAEKVSPLTSEVQDEKCDKRTMCPAGTTCCKKESGLWACCPLPQAVCCSDHEHCCPNGYKCNVAEQSCDKPGGLSLPWLQKTPALQKQPSPARPARNMCDSQTSCPRETTCCFMEKTHRWGCCPLPNAVCCRDGNHCCPSGHSCQPHRASCTKGPRVVPWFTKLSAMTEPGAVTDVKCDDKSSCASGTTCCRLPSGEWGCCPLVKAVCCADHEHCCPQGYSCNMQTGTCEKKDRRALVSSLPQSEVVRSEPNDVPCDCPEGRACCRISAAEWACCPSPRAVCCSDSKRCCPAGSSCDLESGGCTWDIKKDFNGL